ncbi:MAG: amidohydrolase [Planctomycetota bacterium]
MIRPSWLLAPALLGGLFWAVACTLTPEGGPVPDAIFVADRIYTLDPEQPTVEAIACRDGVIVALGSADEIRALAGSATQLVENSGAVLFPGFTDSHMHLEGVGRENLELNLKGTDSLGALLRIIADEAAQRPDGEWITGRGWIESKWSPPEFPTRFDLDAVSPNHPVWLRRVDGHGSIANSRALGLAGINTDTVAPPGGEIVKRDGKVTGMILDAAQILVERKIPRVNAASARRALIEGARVYARRGWTAVQIAGTDAKTADLIQELVASGEIPIRIYNQIYGPGQDATELISNGPSGTDAFSRYTRRGIKVSYDGALGSGGAALLDPYDDRPGNGLLNDHLDRDMARMLEGALRSGVQVEIHAIGDRSNRHVLDLYEAAFHKVPIAERAVPDPRFRIEHAQILHPDDIPRFAELGVIPSMQASHAITDLHFARSRLGTERLKGAYAWRTLVDSGCIIPGGSDAPVEAGEPLVEFYAALTRKDLDGHSAPHWFPELALEREEALRTLTEWAAYAAFEEKWRGTLAVGKACDLTGFDRDLMTVEADQIPSSRCVLTVVGGDVVYRLAPPSPLPIDR